MRLGEAERGVDELDVEDEGYEEGMAPRMRPAAKTQPPTACLMSESPARLPMMNTFLATSREDSVLARSVRPDIRFEGAKSVADVPKGPTSWRRDGER